MVGFIWTARIESVLSGVGRDLHDIVRHFTQDLERLQTTQKLVLAGLVIVGLFFVLLRHFRGQQEGESAGVQFVGLMFVCVTLAAGLGWLAGGQTT